jgi:hypothetical protein
VSSPSECPGGADLKRFLLGRSAQAERARVGDHVRECPQCLEALGALEENDPLVEALRSGRDAGPEDRLAVERLVGRLGDPVRSPAGTRRRPSS